MLSRLLHVRHPTAKQAVITAIDLLGLLKSLNIGCHFYTCLFLKLLLWAWTYCVLVRFLICSLYENFVHKTLATFSL